MNLERGLANLERTLKRCGVTSDSATFLDFLVWQSQLHDSIANQRRYPGVSSQENQRREPVLRELDRLAMQYATKSFADLCQDALIADDHSQATLPAPPAHAAVAQHDSQDQPAPDYDVFISYSHHDGDWVRGTLLPLLQGAGLHVCIDYQDFDPGVPILVNIEHSVNRSRKTLLVLTPDWVSSQWADFEAMLLLTKDPVGRGRRMLPLLVRPCQLPDRLSIFTYLDLTNPGDQEFQMQRLLATIRSAPQPPALERAMSREPLPTPARFAGTFSHERGLTALGGLLVNADVAVRLDFTVLESRLLDNLKDERLYGPTDTIHHERARVMRELNRLALIHLGRSFNALCGGLTMHLTMRVAWHDNRWNGTICREPSRNSFCVALDRIREAPRDDVLEDRLAGELWADLRDELLPPCKAEGGAFMSPVEWTRTLVHPYVTGRATQATHGHLLPLSA